MKRNRDPSTALDDAANRGSRIDVLLQDLVLDRMFSKSICVAGNRLDVKHRIGFRLAMLYCGYTCTVLPTTAIVLSF